MSPNFEKIYKLLRKNYVQIPLERVGKKPYNNFVATLLSPRTRDEVTYEAFKRLKKVAKNFHELSKIPEKKLARLIYPVAFYNVKARNLLNTSRLIVTNFKGKVPKTIEDLLKLPGVGRKVGNIVLAQSFGQDAISVDTHVHRISNMLSWVKTKTPQQTEKALMERLPKKYWRDTNKLLVSIGRQYPSKRKLAKFLESLTS